MDEAKSPAAVAQDAGSVARSEVQLLRDTVEMGMDVARDVGGKILEVVGVRKPSQATKRQVASVKRSKPATTAKRVVKASSKRTEKLMKAAKKGATRKGAARKPAARKVARRRTRTSSRGR